ncbi:predicted protein [Micromonas commoda]|uniref:Uncharacterized protein n=1 Tax=Micromonas commoda (strain RCC299 / NOUM17 / CCMP2709) TaxID=296587 RepID=C1E0S4_MICCC|nr:predicted protein [Micromonas commoda]ACO62053.1 predicted protein [Micromonas commoda]|eukprot:XP_002500795.1 predicted protein [Micromonas commoda]
MPPPRGRGASPFGDPFTFGKPLVLNSQPPTFFGSSLAPPADASASDAPMGGGAVTRSRSARRKVGGYGVTAPAKHGPKDTFTRTTGTDAPSPITGDDRDRPARRVAPRVVTKIPVLDDWEPAEDENEDPSVIPPHVDDVPASAAATKAARGRNPARTAETARGPAPRRPPPVSSRTTRTTTTKRPASANLREEDERGRNDAAAVVIAARARAKARLAPPRVAFGGRPPKKPSPVKRQRHDPDQPPPPDDQQTAADVDVVPRPKPGFSFGVRPNRGGPSLWGPGKDSPGPAAYHEGPAPECDQVRGHVPAVTFGAPPDRTRRSGAGWNAGAFPELDPDAPGPGEYAGGDDTARVLDKIAGKSRAPAFTFGGGKDDIGKVAAKDFAGAPGPGAYHIDEILAVAAERRRIEKGFSFGERVGAAWHEAGPGRDAPAPGTYADGTEVRRSGGGFSFGNAPKTPSFIPSSKDGPTPGPGDYLDRKKEKENGGGENDGGDGRTRKSAEGGFTFGWRRPDPAKSATEPGPGAYHRDAQLDDPEALRPGPAFSLGTKLERGGALDGKKDAAKMPGPGDYEVRKSAEAGPSYTIFGRPNDGVVVGVDLNEKASLPGPGRYHTPLSPGGRAYTLGSRIEEKDAKRDTPAPGEYGAPMPVGAQWGDRNRGFSVLGRDAWAGKGWGEEHAEVPGVGRYDVRGSNSKPLPSAPAFTMAGKTKDPTHAPPPTRDIGPGEYDGDGGNRPPSGPSFTIGVRGSKDGAYGDLESAAEKPGPGAYPNAPKAKDETRESAPSFTLGRKIDVPDERTKVGPTGFSERPGPGEYHADGDVVPPEGPGGFTIYERTKSTEFRPGVDSPGPAYYGGFTTDDVEGGLRMSIHERYESGSVFQHTDRSDTPGPGEYAPEVFQFPVRDDGESTSFVGAPPGYTIGVRRESNYPVRRSQIGAPGPGEYHPTEGDGVTDPAWSKGVTIGERRDERARRSLDSRPGPGHYHRTRESIERETGRKAPVPGPKIRDRKPWEREKVLEKKADVPGPSDYDTEPSMKKMDKRAPAHRIGERRNDAADRRGSGEGAPGPGEYAGDVVRAPDWRRGATIIADRRERSRASAERRPGPGEYHRDAPRVAKTGVNIGRGAGKDAPGGVFDAAGRGGPGPGEFEPPPGAIRPGRSTGVNIARGTGKDAPGGVFERAGRDVPGPGEHWPDGDAASGRGGRSGGKSVRAPGVKIPATGHDAPGGAAVWPEDAPGPGEYHEERTKPVRSAVNIGKASGKDAPGGVFDAALKRGGGPGPGEFESGPGALRQKSTAVNMGKGTGREAPGGAMDRRDGPGPGEFWPDEDPAAPTRGHTQRGIPFGKPPKPPRPGAKKSSAPGPGEYAGSVVGAPDARVGPTIPRGKRRGLVSKDARDTPAPGDFEPDHHPKTVAGLVREALKRPGSMREPTVPRGGKKAGSERTPGPGEYYSGRGEIRVDRGVKMPTREAWERDRDRVKGSGLGPKYHPNHEKVSKPLSVKQPMARADDYADSFRSTRGGSRR